MPEVDDRFVISAEEMPKIGDKYRQYEARLVHVRGLVDDMVVIRRWNRHAKDWHYECEPLWAFKQDYEFYRKVGGERGGR